ncbi:uncharacterized protein M421DRAFT_420166 [Didymella exigua CBS 183.55]|uniref:F-box domain-containing protein n=1 Tax=Didymella exigua CBS 183.55 TaxID=1150837 RepID=A0A6A5RP58_9PLEO|nr:uncharacterized protein M421DRAFT_420166 [Didymella exigua CBS 183.55]KAF1928938.1 hypothetical protein M421DRAFT_420166 [Didymella exigua CBS 183.55]
MSSTTIVNRKLSVLSVSSPTSYQNRQSQLYRELELLLDLTPSTFSSSLLRLPTELRAQIFTHLLPPTENARTELHTCLWGAEMHAAEPWRHSIIGYGSKVPGSLRLHPALLLINKKLRDEVLKLYWGRSQLTLHAELRNTKFQNDLFDYSPHILKLPLLACATHVRFYVEWNYTLTKAASAQQRMDDYVRMTDDFCKAMDEILARMGRVEGIELSVLFFWKYRSGKVYALTMGDLFEVEDVLKKYAEPKWLGILQKAQGRLGGLRASAVSSPGLAPGAGVGYKLSSERKGLEQSGGMEIFVSRDLEACMGKKRKEVDYYGNFAVNETLPQPGYEAGNMI